jgi:glycine C-acetyltransferase
MDTEDLRKQLKEHRSEGKRALIITDGVFSMDGDIAPLPEIVELAEEFDAMSYVDDAHGEGVLGDHGRGIADHFHLSSRIDVEMGTFSKALGAVGGFSAGSSQLTDLIKQRSRPFLFSSAMNPVDAAAVLRSIEILESDDSLLKRLWDNSAYLKSGLADLGFNTGTSKTPITPVMVGDEKKTLELSKRLFEDENVFASPIVFPTVAKGTSRIRLMPSAVHTNDDLNVALEAFAKIGKSLGIIS